jgi:4-hydroxy-tetrahydrodipicolinate reductase
VCPAKVTPLEGEVWADDLEHLDPDTVDVVVDLSRTDVARRTLAWVLANHKDAVIGTSGLGDDDLETAAQGVGPAGSRILVVPNFSIGAILLQRFATAAAPYFTSVEIVELHHDEKRDAPSGTSIATARALAAARRANGLGDTVDQTSTATLEGARGAMGPGGIRIHSVRLPGLLAHQEVLLGAPGEGMVLRHDTYDRSSFMAGLLLAVRRVDAVEGLVVGLDAVLDA